MGTWDKCCKLKISACLSLHCKVSRQKLINVTTINDNWSIYFAYTYISCLSYYSYLLLLAQNFWIVSIGVCLFLFDSLKFKILLEVCSECTQLMTGIAAGVQSVDHCKPVVVMAWKVSVYIWLVRGIVCGVEPNWTQLLSQCEQALSMYVIDFVLFPSLSDVDIVPACMFAYDCMPPTVAKLVGINHQIPTVITFSLVLSKERKLSIWWIC